MEKYSWIYTNLNGHQNNFFFCLPQEKNETRKHNKTTNFQDCLLPGIYSLSGACKTLYVPGYRQCHTNTLILQELRCFPCSVKRHLGLVVAGEEGREKGWRVWKWHNQAGSFSSAPSCTSPLWLQKYFPLVLQLHLTLPLISVYSNGASHKL